MAEDQDHAVETRKTGPAERTEDRPVFTPYVDIYEDEDGLTLIADMPGVPPDGLDVRVEKETLTIRGAVPEFTLADGQAVYAEYGTGDYERSFTISHAVDTAKIGATMKDGVLTLSLPKAEEAKERKIPVKAG